MKKKQQTTLTRANKPNTKLDFKNDRMLQIASFVFVLLVISFLYNRVLPWWLEMIIIVTALAGVALVGFNRLPKSVQITGIVLMLIGSMGLFYSQSLLNRAFRQITTEKTIVSFVVLNESPIESLENGENYRYGYSEMLDQELKELVIETVEEEFGFVIDPNTYFFDDQVFAALLSNEIEVMIVDNALVSLFDEEYPNFWNEVRVIYEIEKEYERDTTRTDVDFSKDPFVVYISGLDTEGPLSSRSRSDVNILMFVNPSKGEILQVSLPRDLYLPISCRNNVKDKLGHTGVYGVNCSIDTIQNFMNLEIDLFARVNFTSFIEIINVIGDIEVYSEYSFYPQEMKSLLVRKGMNTFNAEEALAFARERKRLPGGDITRGLNQQEVIKGVIRKLVSPSQVFRIEGIIKQTAKSVDTNATSDDLLKVVNRQISENINWNFTSKAMTGTGVMLPSAADGGRLIYYLQPSQEVYKEIQALIKEVMSD